MAASLLPSDPASPTRLVMDKDEAREYLSYLLNKSLRVVTTDGRMFWGSFKCTDPVRRNPALHRRRVPS